jgi:hypothetical protein
MRSISFVARGHFEVPVNVVMRTATPQSTGEGIRHYPDFDSLFIFQARQLE